MVGFFDAGNSRLTTHSKYVNELYYRTDGIWSWKFDSVKLKMASKGQSCPSSGLFDFFDRGILIPDVLDKVVQLGGHRNLVFCRIYAANVILLKQL